MAKTEYQAVEPMEGNTRAAAKKTAQDAKGIFAAQLPEKQKEPP